MDFELSEELLAARDLARDFAEKEIAPDAAKDDKERTFRRDLETPLSPSDLRGNERR